MTLPSQTKSRRTHKPSLFPQVVVLALRFVLYFRSTYLRCLLYPNQTTFSPRFFFLGTTGFGVPLPEDSGQLIIKLPILFGNRVGRYAPIALPSLRRT